MAKGQCDALRCDAGWKSELMERSGKDHDGSLSLSFCS
jgi:hypothetical protein